MSGKIKGRAPNEWWVGVVAGMASYIDAAALAGTGIALTIYQLSIGVTANQLGVMPGALTMSVAIAALVGGRLGDRFGRRRVFLTTMVLIVLGSALATFGTAFAVLLTGVILIGFGVGADLPVSLATIAEAASNRNRGKLILLSNMLWLVGIIASTAIASVTGNLGRLGGQQLASAVQWMEHVERGAGPGMICHDTEQFGDWLDPSAPPENPFEATTDQYLVATAYFAQSARCLAAIAEVLGERQLASRYAGLADKVREAYMRTYVRDDGLLTSDSQTAYALTTVFDLWPNVAAREAGTNRLTELVRNAGGAIATGFAGTPVTTDALAMSGHLAEAYQLLQHEECPSWLYPVRMGGTTTWERWDSLKPDGTVNSPTMTSFNHYALGAVASWLHRVVAGIEAIEPGYRRIRFAPRLGGSLTSAGATHVTPYGVAAIDWVLDEGVLVVDVVVPTGSTAVVDLPDGRTIDVGHGRHRLVTDLDAGPHSDERGSTPSDTVLQSFVARLDLEEKVALLTGQDSWSLPAVPSIGLRSIVMSDGPAGVRGQSWDEREPSVSFPSPGIDRAQRPAT